MESIADAAAGILATASAPRGGSPTFIRSQDLQALRRWASESIEPNEIAHPQLIAAVLLWADTWKNGS
jgi:hypothetical protein